MAVKDLYNSTRIADEPGGYGFNNVFSAEMYGESRRTIMMYMYMYVYAVIHFSGRSEAFQIVDEAGLRSSCLLLFSFFPGCQVCRLPVYRSNPPKLCA